VSLGEEGLEGVLTGHVEMPVGTERRNMPVGMCSRQNPIDVPSVILSIP